MKKGRQTQDGVANVPGVAQGPSQQVWDGRLLDDQVGAEWSQARAAHLWLGSRK